MNLIPSRPTGFPTTAVPPLHNGDRLTQAEFHRRYEASPKNVRAELIGGIVYMSSPLRRPHGVNHVHLSYLLNHYSLATPGLELLDNATTILDEDSEPQPDLSLRILPEHGGQSRDTPDQYIEGPPELVAEVAHSSVAIDLHQKRQDYQRAGVLEYLVLCLEEREAHWYHFPTDSLLQPKRQGVTKSLVFPGLWLHLAALLALDVPGAIAALQKGLASREHRAFVKQLAARKQPPAEGRP